MHHSVDRRGGEEFVEERGVADIADDKPGGGWTEERWPRERSSRAVT